MNDYSEKRRYRPSFFGSADGKQKGGSEKRKQTDSVQEQFETFGEDFSRYAKTMERKQNKKERKKYTSTRRTLNTVKQPESGIPEKSVKEKMEQYRKTHQPYQIELTLEEPVVEPKVEKRPYGYYDEGHRKETFMSAEEAKVMAREADRPTCTYCGNKGVIKTAKEYRNISKDFCYWVCEHCEDVCVTTIKGTSIPSGVMADKELRKLRSKTHKLIEFKKKELSYNRGSLALWIADTLRLEPEEAKIGILDEAKLELIIQKANQEVYQKRYAHIFDK